ncbi:polysaccharide deacetylase family protein, partial [Streptomyces sp. SID337]|nr:polysaccharide deacetylase family protein [Streptomyces sp. SID337]
MIETDRRRALRAGAGLVAAGALTTGCAATGPAAPARDRPPAT